MTTSAADMLAYDALMTLLQQRYSCRGFRPNPVPREVIEQVLSAAQRTASWCNTQPWHVHIVSGQAKDRLAQALYPAGEADPIGAGDFPFPTQYVGAYRERRRTCGYQLYESVGIARQDSQARLQQALENFRFFGAPHVALIFTENDIGTYGAVDCGAYLSHFMLAATALGLGTIAQASLAGFPNLIRQQLDIPDHQRLVCGVSFGYPDTEHPINRFRTERADPSEVVRWHE